ncbi:MAG: hypothetical protein NVSMB3_04660 [Acidobacteriaceae bacterium]
MQTQTQLAVERGTLTERRFGSRPVWVQILALVCLLLVVVVSTAQVCHVHEKASVRQGSRQGDPAPENHCPLCVAMHSALPTGVHVAPEPLASVRALDSIAADAERMFRWRFEMASRPPPVAAAFA